MRKYTEEKKDFVWKRGAPEPEGYSEWASLRQQFVDGPSQL